MTLAGSNEQPPSGQPTDRLAAHTLVIPTFNRPALLQRLVTYYASRAKPRPQLATRPRWRFMARKSAT
jgi:hypothetical protein